MSGIAGVFLRSHMGWLEPRDHFSMLGALAHRGAKGFEFWTNPNHTMLMLYARSKGGSDLPFFLDADSVLCVNLDGRIYNCSDLPDRFRKEGADCFAGLEGGFAFALYDERENALYLVRDKFGARTLYYAEASPAFVFGSEVKAVLSYAELDAKFDLKCLRASLSGLSLPGTSIFDGVKEVPPGHYVKITGDSIDVRSYCEPSPGNFDRSVPPEIIREDLVMRLDKAVASHCRGSGRVGVFLSAGFSSSAIADSLSRNVAGTHQAFTIRFDGSRSDEPTVAARVASQCGIDHEIVPMSTRSLADNFQIALWHAERPAADASGSAWYLLSKTCGSRVDSIVSGLGAAELLAGSGQHRHQVLLDRFRRTGERATALNIRALLRRERRSPDVLPLKQYGDAGVIESIFGFYPYVALRALRLERFLGFILSDDLNEAAPFESVLEDFAAALPLDELRGLGSAEASRFLHLNREFVYRNLPPSSGRMPMAHSLDPSMPFLDSDLEQLASSLPMGALADERHGQLPLRQAMFKRLPRYICEATELPFVVPSGTTGRLLETTLHKLALSENAIRNAGIFKPDKLGLLIKAAQFVPGATRIGRELRAVVTLALSVQLLHELFATNFKASANNFVSSSARRKLDELVLRSGG